MSKVNQTKEKARLFKLLLRIYFVAIVLRVFLFYLGIRSGLLGLTERLKVYLLLNPDYIKTLVLLFPSVILAFFFFTCIASIWSSLYFLNKHRRHLSKAIPILAINLLTLGIILSINDFIVLPDFFLNLKDRQAAVELLLTNYARDNEVSGRGMGYVPYVEIELPPQYRHLSQGFNIKGAILINLDNPRNTPISLDGSENAKAIIFTNYIDIKGKKFSAFIYRTDTVDKIPEWQLQTLADIAYVWILETKKLTNHWFWVEVVKSPW
ncbi:hypothetical protein H6F77_21505 [Microcoleus sp. FACHB-831]|uniref:hypothetical protein n=1 Tax=Microcoleus sp. FACHB-831 TaxID=2692827 RepID=UPI0016865DC1|nr:hypothetical protein [Microcoleus sp. FACHB-831]MBD1923629.1 hypothetical protein [Microcoleus sp. FACHB-831]